MNVGNLIRSAHAFGASFVFTVGEHFTRRDARSDTSDAFGQVPFYKFDSPKSMRLPDECALVGVELLDGAVELPSFRHPRCAAYVLGPERGDVSSEMLARCDHVIKIPTQFCINLATAGAIVMYDRLLSSGRFGVRPVVPGGDVVPMPDHVHGGPVFRRDKALEDT